MDVLKKIINFLIQLLNILLIILSFALLFISIFKKEWFELFIEWMKWVINGLWAWNYIILFFSSLIEAFPVLWVLLPWQNILLIVGGFFGHNNYENLVYVIFVASLWAIAWNYIWFLLGKKYGEHFFDTWWVWFGIGKTEVKYLKKWIDKWWAWGITIGKFHPITRSFLPFVAGSMWMKSGKFMIYNAIGSFIRATTIILLWVVFVKYYKILLEYSGTISLVVFGLIWAYIYKYKRTEFKTYWEEKNAEIEEQANKK